MILNLEEENKKLKECNKSQSEVINNVFIPQKERLEEENKKLKEILNRIKELYEDEEEAELLNYLDENLDEI